MSARALAATAASWLCVLMSPVAADADGPSGSQFGAGSPGVGDPYFPHDGNGGYDVEHYELDIDYDPASNVLAGVTTIRATATQALSGFNLDLVSLHVRSIVVNGRAATWTRDGGELSVAPARGIAKGSSFVTVVTYDGIPQTLAGPFSGLAGFLHTDDGTVVAGEPHVAATWFPVNDHPSDRASYTFRITVPEGLEAVANGMLVSRRTRAGRTTWIWEAREPMAPYLTTATIGEFDLRSHRQDGIRYWDAIDSDLSRPVSPRTGERFAISQTADASYKRLLRSIDVPAGGAQLAFWVVRDTEAAWDFMFVEARAADGDGWTTLRDLNGHTSADTGQVCPYWLSLHPFLSHYQSPDGTGGCVPTGTTGEWWAASGASDGYERWIVDLSDYAGRRAEVSITYASDDINQLGGLFVDDVAVFGAAGSTSFEQDGDTLDGWTFPGPPEGGAQNLNDWIVGSVDDTPPTTGEIVEATLARQPEIIAFLSGLFGPYPFSTAGAIVDDTEDLHFALENQTRPVYSKGSFVPGSGESIVVHELAHQWTGDSLALASWMHIWLNEGFATYAEWLWSEHEDVVTAQQQFDFVMGVPARSSFWSSTIGDPGSASLFEAAVYFRGAATLHALRLKLGDQAFFRLLRRWADEQAGDTVSTAEFIGLAEEEAGRDLDAFFDAWLFTPSKPAGVDALTSRAADGAAATPQPGMLSRAHHHDRRPVPPRARPAS